MYETEKYRPGAPAIVTFVAIVLVTTLFCIVLLPPYAKSIMTSTSEPQGSSSTSESGGLIVAPRLRVRSRRHGATVRPATATVPMGTGVGAKGAPNAGAEKMLAEMTRRFAKRVIDVYIEGAIKLADELGIDSFCVVAPGRDLNNATDYVASRTKWRYKKLVDGTTYIASLAMQEVVVSEGLYWSLPWVQSVLNPRLKASIVNGRIVADIKRRSLLGSGDIESNPGPGLFPWPLEMSDFSDEQILRHVEHFASIVNDVLFQFYAGIAMSFEFTFGGYLDDWAIDCDIDRIQNEWIVYGYRHPWLAVILGFFRPFVPSYGSARNSLICHMMLKWRPVPHHSYVSVNDAMNAFGQYLTQLTIVFAVVSGLIVSCLVVSFMLWKSKFHRRFKVFNNQEPFRVNEIKDQFVDYLDGLKEPVHVSGQHNILAWERRAAESFCIDLLLDKFPCFRDVGGSRVRWPELGLCKHVCGPIMNNDDLLRSAKDPRIFPNCNKPGECCPERRHIPAAILSHVDYHMSIRQLSSVICGPTFIINHDFDLFRHGVGTYQDNGVTHYEAKIVNKNGLIDMTPIGGTPYLQHGYHHWKSEGSVVSDYGAFVYTRVGFLGTTAIYYCHPSAGVYNMDDVNNLVTSSTDSYPNIDGHRVTRVNGTIPAVMGQPDYTHYRFDHPDGSCLNISAAVIDECAMAMSSCQRDNKYADTLRSLLTGKMKASKIDMSALKLCSVLVSFLSDRYAVDIVPYASVISGNPTSFSYFDIAINKLRSFVWNKIADYQWSRRVCGDFAAKYAPWSFPSVKVPTYEVYSQVMSCKFGNGRRTLFNQSKFRSTTPAINASTNQQFVAGPSQNSQQCAGCLGNTSAQPCAQTPPIVNPVNPPATTPCSVNAQSSSATASPIVQVVAGSNVGVAPNSKTSLGCSNGGSSGPNGKQPISNGATTTTTTTTISTNVKQPVFEYPLSLYDVNKGCITFDVVGRKKVSVKLDYTGKPGEILTDFHKAGELEPALREIERMCETSFRGSVRPDDLYDWVLCYLVNPTGKFSDKSSVPKGSCVFPRVKGEVVDGSIFTTVDILGVGFSVYIDPAKAVSGGKGVSRKVAPKPKGRSS